MIEIFATMILVFCGFVFGFYAGMKSWGLAMILMGDGKLDRPEIRAQARLAAAALRAAERRDPVG